ncbi:MAG TPA: glycosyltransferase family 4 protein [Allosphingosinicella sp.]
MHIVYPLLWSTLGRQACREQSVSTAAALARRGVEVTLSMPRLAGDPALTADELRAYYDVEGDFRLIQRPSRWASEKFVPSVLRIREALADPALAGADLLYSRIPAMLAFGRYAPLPFATDHYRPWPDDWPWLRPIVRGTARRRHSLGFILHSEYAAASYAKAGIPAGQLLVAHNGADPKRMQPRLGKKDARKRLGLPAGRPILLYAGRINGEKGLDSLLALAVRRPDVLVVLVGSEGDGPIERKAARIANVRVEPWQAPGALAPWLYAADILAIPPAAAPLRDFSNCVLPMKLFAYLAAGRPILAPFSPDTAELLKNGHNALLVPPDDPAAAEAGIDRLLGEPAFARDLGENGRLLAEGLSWDDRAARIHAFLAERLEAVRRGPSH